MIISKSCKYAHHYWEQLGERWMGQCPMFECLYEGELLTTEVCDENESCPAFELNECDNEI